MLARLGSRASPTAPVRATCTVVVQTDKTHLSNPDRAVADRGSRLGECGVSRSSRPVPALATANDYGVHHHGPARSNKACRPALSRPSGL